MLLVCFQNIIYVTFILFIYYFLFLIRKLNEVETYTHTHFDLLKYII